MNEEEYPSSSDVSDEDYCPDAGDVELPSEVDSDGDPENAENEATSTTNKGKNKRLKTPVLKTSKRKKISDKPSSNKQNENIETEVKEVTKEDLKKKADSLWADFLIDTNTKPRSSTNIATTKNTEDNATRPLQATFKPSVETVKNTVRITKTFEFAGEEVKVEKVVAADSAEARFSTLTEASEGTGQKINPSSSTGPVRSKGGLGGIKSILGQLGKKSKISTLEKSKLDWDGFKQKEGIDEEIQTHNKGKDGYLEKQDFLERTDLRRFEIEKQMRAARRSHR